jgi:hypothetical protein
VGAFTDDDVDGSDHTGADPSNDIPLKDYRNGTYHQDQFSRDLQVGPLSY